ncbi:MAG: NnrS family protein [Deltaproteobacteria bacterium]|nr:NnrS family protein [Deltaproteobacteria bacterium]MBT4267842.1 NnrS family protein [Deltaproteobacteria bacterium]MBT4638243.1 NnrS family protein [Deltaproteobacteria bacterium]MBT6499179.1 NnrS family protein [Deltaproteobacteria bacterium]MBT6610748.1 NnrS family protein [Deltaproteobacteria bacterium]
MKNKIPVFLTYAFRPLFVAAGLYGIIATGWWGIVYLLGTAFPPTSMDPVSWHSHEMVYGFTCAAIGGFLLTAVANWTKRPPVAGHRLSLLTVAWICGRIAISLSAILGPLLTALIDLSYMVMLIVLFGNEVIKAKDRRNYKVIVMLILICLFNLMFHFEYTFSLPIPPRLSIRGAIMVILMLIGTISGRIIPNFTRNWLQKNQKEHISPPPPFGKLDMAVMGLTGLLAAGWTIDPYHIVTILGSFIISGLHIIRLARWRGFSTVPDPLLLVLHVGYAWIPVGFLLSAWAALTEALMFSAALHGLTIGAVGLMIVAVGSRSALGHTGRELKAGKVMTLVYALIVMSTIWRILAGIPDYYIECLLASILSWCLALFIFLVRFYPVLTQPRIDS